MTQKKSILKKITSLNRIKFYSFLFLLTILFYILFYLYHIFIRDEGYIFYFIAVIAFVMFTICVYIFNAIVIIFYELNNRKNKKYKYMLLWFILAPFIIYIIFFSIRTIGSNIYQNQISNFEYGLDESIRQGDYLTCLKLVDESKFRYDLYCGSSIHIGKILNITSEEASYLYWHTAEKYVEEGDIESCLYLIEKGKSPKAAEFCTSESVRNIAMTNFKEYVDSAVWEKKVISTRDPTICFEAFYPDECLQVYVSTYLDMTACYMMENKTSERSCVDIFN